MKYIFLPEETKSTEKIINAPEEVEKRNGEYLLPFSTLIDPEIRVYERYGYLLQEQDRLKNLKWIQADLEAFLQKWNRFHADKIFHSLYRDKKGNPSFENVWKGFLDYSGKKGKYRMRKTKSNREVLQNKLKIKVDWNKNSEELFPTVLGVEKLKAITSAIEKTLENILKTETALEVALVLLRKKLEKTEEGSVDHVGYDSLVEKIKTRAKEALEETPSSFQKPSAES